MLNFLHVETSAENISLKRQTSWVYLLFHKVVQLLLYRALSLVKQNLKNTHRRNESQRFHTVTLHSPFLETEPAKSAATSGPNTAPTGVYRRQSKHDG